MGGNPPDPSFYTKFGMDTVAEDLAPVWKRFENLDWRGVKMPEMAQASSSKAKEAEAYREKAEASTYDKASDAEKGQIEHTPEAGPSSLAGAMSLPVRARMQRSASMETLPRYEDVAELTDLPEFPSVPTQMPGLASASDDLLNLPDVPGQLPAYSREASPEEQDREPEYAR